MKNFEVRLHDGETIDGTVDGASATVADNGTLKVTLPHGEGGETEVTTYSPTAWYSIKEIRPKSSGRISSPGATRRRMT